MGEFAGTGCSVLFRDLFPIDSAAERKYPPAYHAGLARRRGLRRDERADPVCLDTAERFGPQSHDGARDDRGGGSPAVDPRV